MNGQNDILAEEVETTGRPFCDGCEKEIGLAKTFLKWFWSQSGEDVWSNELHSHDRNICIGKVMRKIFS